MSTHVHLPFLPMCGSAVVDFYPQGMSQVDAAPLFHPLASAAAHVKEFDGVWHDMDASEPGAYVQWNLPYATWYVGPSVVTCRRYTHTHTPVASVLVQGLRRYCGLWSVWGGGLSDCVPQAKPLRAWRLILRVFCSSEYLGFMWCRKNLSRSMDLPEVFRDPFDWMQVRRTQLYVYDVYIFKIQKAMCMCGVL